VARPDAFSARQAELRLRASLVLAGCAAGALIAYFTGSHFARDCIFGGFAGMAFSWVIKLAGALRQPR
jgi:hypothetical protein